MGKQVTHIASFAFYFKKNFYFVDEFDDLIERLNCAGLTKDVDSMKTNQKNPPAITYIHIYSILGVERLISDSYLRLFSDERFRSGTTEKVRLV